VPRSSDVSGPPTSGRPSSSSPSHCLGNLQGSVSGDLTGSYRNPCPLGMGHT
jgi:hypothetical protein